MLKFEGDDRSGADHFPAQPNQEPIANPPAPEAKKKPRSEKQREASRRNGSRSHGPDDTTGTRYNAMRHGLRARGLTPWDDGAEYLRNLSALEDKYGSSDPFDQFFLQEAALEMTRMPRINRLEADKTMALSSFSEPPDNPTSDGTPTIHFAALKEYGAPAFDLINRYKTSCMNRLLQCRRELERVPRDEASQRSADETIDDDSIPN